MNFHISLPRRFYSAILFTKKPHVYIINTQNSARLEDTHPIPCSCSQGQQRGNKGHPSPVRTGALTAAPRSPPRLRGSNPPANSSLAGFLQQHPRPSPGGPEPSPGGRHPLWPPAPTRPRAAGARRPLRGCEQAAIQLRLQPRLV